MSNFQPRTELYGMPVDRIDEDGDAWPIGNLDAIKSPHCFVVNGIEWEIDSSDNMFVEGGRVGLNWAWK